ncbi:MAG: L-threonylcarbamoyladenylate synthase [Planctomycetota bacterium]
MAEIVALNPASPDPYIISKAARILTTGGLVAFPTETVYGLGADATNPDSILKIYSAKGRPPTNPLIVHCESIERIRLTCVAQWPDQAQKLADAFWPGPLTLILPKSDHIPDIATAGLPHVGVRIPQSLVACALISACDRPIAAPSANRSNRISPTLAEHVAADLGDQIQMILDAGPCRAGVESTVLDLTRTIPAILRPGPIKAAQIAKILGQQVHSQNQTLAEDQAHASPGQSRVHYAPWKPLTLWLNSLPDAIVAEFGKSAVLVLGDTTGLSGLQILNANQRLDIRNPDDAEHALYALLHRWDRDLSVQEIHVVMASRSEAWVALINRLGRAAIVIY